MSKLQSKLKELATGGDAAALAEVRNLETWIQNEDLNSLQKFERGLIDLAAESSKCYFRMKLPVAA